MSDKTEAEHSTELDQEGLEEHFRTFFRSQSTDFRASSIARLVEGYMFEKKEKILDLGCGSCVVTAHLLRRGFDVTSCDTSEAMIRMANQILSEEQLPTDNLHLMNVADCQQRYSGVFDKIINLDVIEHIQDDKEALAQMYDILAPRGQLILSVPAHPSLYGPKDVQVGHYRRYDKAMLAQRLQEAGFRNIRLRYWNFIGFLSVWVATKLFKTGISESFRSTQRTPLQSVLNSNLRVWLQVIENHVPGPIGLTLVALAEKK